MGNILTDALPTSVTVNGKDYAVDTDFRTCLRIMLAFEDNELTPFEKQAVLITNLFLERPPDESMEEALREGVVFLDGGIQDGEGHGAPTQPYRLYSFTTDASLIFAAFQQTHGINLQRATDLHWWEFMTLFMDLGEGSAFCNLVSLRKRVKSGKATKEERQMERELGNMFDVPELDARSLEEKEHDREFERREKAAMKRKIQRRKERNKT